MITKEDIIIELAKYYCGDMYLDAHKGCTQSVSCTTYCQKFQEIAEKIMEEINAKIREDNE